MFSLMLRVDAPDAPAQKGGMLSPASDALRKQVYAGLKLKPTSVAWITLVPETTKGDAAIARLIAEREAGRLIVGSAYLTEAIDWDTAGDAEWFLLNTRHIDDFNLWDSYPGCKAGTLPPVHALNGTFVSSAFVETCKERQLRGISFLQCENRGRKKGKPWFVALPDHSFGRGLDHPWFDRAKWLPHAGHRPDRRVSAIDIGQSQFHQRFLRDDARHPVLDAMRRLCPPDPSASSIEGFQIVGIPRYWSGAVPDADFAFVPWGEDGPNRDGKLLRFRQVMIANRARAALIGAGLFKQKAFLPIIVVRNATPDYILDGNSPAIPPMYSTAELAILRARERDL
jgi:hypothetical protein